MITTKDLQRLSFESQIELPDELEDLVNVHRDAVYIPGQTAHYYRFLYCLTRIMKPKFVLELGTRQGISACCMAMGSPESDICTVDIQTFFVTQQLFDKYPNVDFLYDTDSLEVELNGRKIDLLFVDTNHDGKRPEMEWNCYKPHMAPGGIALFDDININEEMKYFWERVDTSECLKVELPIHGECGFGALVVEGKP